MDSANHHDDTAVYEVFEIDSVLKRILSYLSTADLLSSRLVSRNWKVMIDPILQQRPAQISLDKLIRKPPPSSTAFAGQTSGALDQDYAAANLQNLKTAIDKNPNFALRGLIISGCHWKTEVVREFIRTHGNKFSKIQIVSMSPHEISQLLGYPSSQLEHLDLSRACTERDYWNHARSSSLDLSYFWLSSLKKLALPQWLSNCNSLVPFCERVLQASPTNVHIGAVDVNYLKMITNIGKEHLLTHLVAESGVSIKGHIPHVKLLHPPYSYGTALPKLHTLELYLRHAVGMRRRSSPSPAWTAAIDTFDQRVNKLLLLCSSTLTTLRTDYIWVFPVLPKLRSLEIMEAWIDVLNAITTPEAFGRLPRLNIIQILCYGRSSYDSYGTPASTYEKPPLFSPLVTVQMLILQANNSNWKTHLCNDDNLRRLSDSFPSVRTLRIEMRGPTDAESFITGFPAAVCRNLRKSQPILVDQHELDAFRTFGGLQHFPNLEEICIFFDCRRKEYGYDWKEEEAGVEDGVTLTPVSWYYNLRFRPQLRRIRFCYDYRGYHGGTVGKLIQSYASLATIQHEEINP